METSVNGLRLIAGIEKLELESYLDQANVWTIGYGTTRLNGSPVTERMVINETVAVALFRGDIRDAESIVTRYVTRELKQNQFDALVSLAYNIGEGGFAQSSLVKAINSKLLIEEDLFTRWNKVRVNGQLQVSNGLTNRRRGEYALFVSERSSDGNNSQRDTLRA